MQGDLLSGNLEMLGEMFLECEWFIIFFSAALLRVTVF